MWSNVPLWHGASPKKTKVVAGVLEDSRVITRIIVVWIPGQVKRKGEAFLDKNV